MVVEKTMKKLEMEIIRERLAAFAQHPLSRKWAREMPLADSYNQAEDRLYETAAAMELLRRNPDLPMGALPDMDSTMDKIQKHFQINPIDLVHLLTLLEECKDIHRYFKEDSGNKLFNRLMSGMSDIPYVRDKLRNTVDENGEIRDNASSTLAGVRKEIKNKSGEIKRILDHMLKRPNLALYLQDNVVVKRGDSYCLSVKKEFAYKIPGVIEDTSGTGSTVFIEPLEVIGIRGELNRLKRDEFKEIDHILHLISETLHVEKLSLLESYQTMGQYNFYLARGLMTRSFKGYVPKINQRGLIRLREARHPLLFGTVIANDITLGDGYNHLIISGPNTGGKTVLLKMVGLFALMISIGLGLPAGEGSEMAYFQRVLADIGDEQSIENSLSTFSGHMFNIRNMLDNADQETLLLFDELGNGTDPKEGSSLAMAILNYIHEKSCHSITTTHYGELKVFAYNQRGFMNASMAFDVKTLEPSYKLITGIPGASLGIEVARRCGLPMAIISMAENTLSSSDLETGSLLEALETERSTLEESAKRSLEILEENKRIQEELHQEKENFQRKILAKTEKSQEKSRLMLEEIRRESEGIIKELKELKKNDPDRANLARKKLRALESRLDQAVKSKSISNTNHLERGEEVYVASLDKYAQVVECDDHKKIAQLKIGVMKISLPYNDLVVKKPGIEEAYTLEKVLNKPPIPMELDVRGMRVDEALDEIEKYLDIAVLSRYPSIRIIHGMGTGALRKAIWVYLKSLTIIKSYRYGDASEGSIGATVIYF